jgi:prepilin-type N-terminal cleavage/methylation domain-containing protein
MATRRRRSRGFSLLEILISTALLSIVFYLSLSGSAGSMRGSTLNQARLEAMAENAKALVTMNLELQEASVRDETVQIYEIGDDGVMSAAAVDPTLVPPPGTVSPTTDSIGDESYALRFMTVGDFSSVGDNIEVETAGPFHYRLGTGATTDFRRDQLVRIDETGGEQPRVLCRGVRQLIFQRDARGGALLITLVTLGRDPISGTQIPIRQVLTVTPKNDFSENLANFDLNGEEL